MKPAPNKPLYVNGRFLTQKFSGVQRFATEVTLALHSLRADVEILVPPAQIAAPIAGSVTVGRLHGQGWEQLELPRRAADGLLLNLGNTAPLLGRRQIVVIHDAGVFTTPETYPWQLRMWYKAMQKALVLRRTALVTVSEFARREIIQNLGARPEDVTVVSEGADHIGRIAADETILAANGLEAGGFVLAVGNLAAHKNLSALGALAQALAPSGVKLVITGGFGGKAFRATSTLTLPEPALYIGRVSDAALKALYQAAACFVFPSRYEGFGLPMAEAMTCGCPVVASDIPALREIFPQCALFCDPLSPNDIAANVLHLLGDKTLQSKLSEAGMQRTKTMTWQHCGAEMNAIVSRYDQAYVPV
jgi:glycosyltransferase involved in cell wall biosynthesis